MARSFFSRLVWMAALVLLQALVFNHIHWFGYATPYVVVYILCLQPLDTSRCGWLLWGFFAGLASDFFSGVPGVGAVSMTLAAMCAPRILALFAPKDCLEDMVPGYLTLGGWKYVQYVSWLVLLQQAAAVVLEFFSFFNGLELLYTYLCSSALTAVLLLVLEKMRGGR